MATHSSIPPWRIPMERGAWQAKVHGVTKSRTRLWLSTASPPLRMTLQSRFFAVRAPLGIGWALCYAWAVVQFLSLPDPLSFTPSQGSVLSPLSPGQWITCMRISVLESMPRNRTYDQANETRHLSWELRRWPGKQKISSMTLARSLPLWTLVPMRTARGS